MDKIDKLFNYAQDTLVPHVSDHIRCVIFNTVESIFNIRAQLKLIEKDIRKLAATFNVYSLLMTITGCGPLTAAVIIAETGDIFRFKNADHYVCLLYTSPSPRD